MTAGFELDPRLAADTHSIAQWPLCEVLLMDEARYPWLILVPRVDGARDMIDLDGAVRALLWQEIDAASMAVRDLFAPDKLNVAALGNVVEQLHVHVVARYRGDDAWPAPVWGAHPRLSRDPATRATLIERLRAQLPVSGPKESTA